MKVVYDIIVNVLIIVRKDVIILKRLPLGVKSIEELLNNDYLYLDKTMYYEKLINEGKYFFLSRPRRFGKTLFISTLKEIFKGNKELFKDQWIYTNYEFEKHPIIHLDFNEINHKQDINKFEESLNNRLKSIAKIYDVNLRANSSKDIFVELIEKLGEINKVVILIDEYDKPIMDYIGDLKKANENKEFIASFYETIKAKGEYLRFVLLTGVTKVSKTSVFSKLNNLTDISRNTRYSAMLGITEEELYTVFEKYMYKAIEEMNLPMDELKEKLKKWYNGYSWDTKNKVYNPYSILSFFNEYKFDNYWFQTGTPTFLLDIMKKTEYILPSIEEITVGSYIFSEFDLEYMDITSLLFQTGYLTIKDIKIKRNMESFYTLGIPNYEVRSALFDRILQMYTDESVSKVKPPYSRMIDYLEEKKLEKFINELQTSFAQIPYTIYPKKEDYYHSIFFLMMNLIGAKIETEVLTDKGRIDGVLEFDDFIYIIEFKIGNAKEGIDQIKQRKYYQKYQMANKQLILLSVGGFKEKNIEYIVEEM